MQRFILDTSVFTNPEVYSTFATEPHEAVRRFLASARSSRAEFYMPSSVYAEFGKLRELGDLAPEFEAVVRIRAPRRYNIMIPGALLHDFIEEVRTRIDRGLRIAEEHTRRGRGVAEKDAEALINKLREKYREALRQGILDSKEDADVLLLAWELQGILVSGDEGLRKWADRAGIEIARAENLAGMLDTLGETRAGEAPDQGS